MATGLGLSGDHMDTDQQHRAGGQRVTEGRSVSEGAAEQLDTSAGGVVRLVRRLRRCRGRQGSIPAPASSATSGRL